MNSEDLMDVKGFITGRQSFMISSWSLAILPPMSLTVGILIDVTINSLWKASNLEETQIAFQHPSGHDNPYQSILMITGYVSLSDHNL